MKVFATQTHSFFEIRVGKFYLQFGKVLEEYKTPEELFIDLEKKCQKTS